MNTVKELEPEEKVALGASLFFALGLLLAAGLLWDCFSGKEGAWTHGAPLPAEETNSLAEVHEALDGALESISNRLFRTARPSDLR